jgi:hypothetical protein|tara:strand:- start:4151 stop:5689 length:1539 start_codon:yes stop_codon:yes gene_type:complete
MPYMPKSIPKKYHGQLSSILENPLSFFKLLKITDKQTQKLIPFYLNAEQSRLLKLLELKNKIIILKPRQIGISTLIRAYAFWRAYCADASEKWGVISFHDRSAKHLRGMDAGFYDGLPELMQRDLQINNTTDLKFADTGATLSSYTAGSKGGTRSFSLTSAHLSEFAYYTDPSKVLAATTATLPKDGKLLIESTPHKAGDIFHQLCINSPDNGWTLICFWWWEHEAYQSPAPSDFEPTEEEVQLIAKFNLNNNQLQWRRETVGTIGIDDFRREYPASLDDAFHLGDSNFFSNDALNCIEPIAMRGEDITLEAPEENNVYVAGVDVAAGVNRDYSVLTIASAMNNQVVYTYRSNRKSPTAFAEIIYKKISQYNDAFTLVESNNHGHLILDRLRLYGFTNLWVTEKRKDWTTTLPSKVNIYEILREYIHNNMILKLPDVTLLELHSLVVEKIAPEAPKGMHDDLAMSLALCYRALRDCPKYQIHSKREHLMDSLISERRRNNIMSKAIPWQVAR